ETNRAICHADLLSNRLETKMNHVRRVGHLRDVQFDHGRAVRLEQAATAAQQHRHNMDMQLVEQAPRQELLDQVGATAYPDMLLSGSRPRLRQRTVDSVRDEVKRCAALFDKRLALAVRHDKDWHVERRLVAPRPLAAIE